VFNHFSVVVAADSAFPFASVGHGEPPNEVGEPHEGGPFQFGVFMQVVVCFPGFVADEQVVVVLFEDIVHNHEIGRQDFVHSPPRLEAVQVVPT
jgi:hypothetical protein